MSELPIAAMSELSEESRRGLQHMMQQVLLLIIMKAGGSMDVDVAELDTKTVKKYMTMSVSSDKKRIVFQVKEKS